MRFNRGWYLFRNQNGHKDAATEKREDLTRKVMGMAEVRMDRREMYKVESQARNWEVVVRNPGVIEVGRRNKRLRPR